MERQRKQKQLAAQQSKDYDQKTLGRMLKETSMDYIAEKHQNAKKGLLGPNKGSQEAVDGRVSSPTLSSSFWRQKNYGELNYGMRQLPMKEKNVDLLANAYDRDYQRKVDLGRYYGELRDQYIQDRKNRDLKDRRAREMDHKYIDSQVSGLGAGRDDFWLKIWNFFCLKIFDFFDFFGLLFVTDATGEPRSVLWML